MKIQDYLKDKKHLIDEYLPSYIKDKAIPSPLKEAMLYSLEAGGKRLRPILTLSVLEAFGQRAEIGMEAACALEMVHTYSLIHDDLPSMDDDDLRRGKPTNHKMFGEATAILAGDALLTMSFQLIAQSSTYTSGHKVELLSLLAEAAGAEGMVAGQTVDMESENMDLTLDELQSIHERKTGRLLEASVLFGAILANASEHDLAQLRAFSRHLGIAFQIQDDILDVMGDSELMGKLAGSDEHNMKSTYPKLLTLDGAKEQLARHLMLSKENLRKADVDPVILEGIADYIVNRNH
ncbi:geranylgeranyl diphosphate synthase, type II [Fictibacillus enclensis]|uniref:Farnesyl diphosphate synthase n=1 Tax=Fictibacillus enclensis TaxID=1017270 RepID=A0A0V8JFM6_9BACL|nr:farnesyl diphosphate synthase [Fictibacillus enclensis]KSU85704.1 farnesyl-diphosphate synthase [Fictibacillus enclensis]SCC01222.1 geranylgeranyl diphosphate synthase, type II [Fictibacillus enclensis]